jgi:hypothetical protein
MKTMKPMKQKIKYLLKILQEITNRKSSIQLCQKENVMKKKLVFMVALISVNWIMTTLYHAKNVLNFVAIVKDIFA